MKTVAQFYAVFMILDNFQKCFIHKKKRKKELSNARFVLQCELAIANGCPEQVKRIKIVLNVQQINDMMLHFVTKLKSLDEKTDFLFSLNMK